MSTLPLVVLPVLIACLPFLHAADVETKASLPARKPQLLSSPDQVPEGLAKSDWSSIRAAYEAGRHAFQPIEGGWQARNPGQQWTTKFDKRGFLTEPKGGGWQWGLELKSYGFGAEQHAINGTPAVKADGQRLSYQWDASVQEWFVNDQRGLEHGFTIGKRPEITPGSQPSTLDFLLATRGTLRPNITADAQGVLFQDSAGATVLNYTGLKVWDADGKILHSRFEAAGETDIRLLVEERGARYPLTIDPIAQQAYLKASNTGASDSFGQSVSVSGDTVVVGANGDDSSTTGVNSTSNESASNSGAAYVFVRSGTTWSQQAYLKAANTGSGDNFGYSVSVSGDTLVVGATGEDSSTAGANSMPNESASNSGAVYVFTRSGTTWSQQSYLKASNTGASDAFGLAVAVSGDTVVVGAYQEDSSTTGVNSIPDESANSSGAAYVFSRSGTTWSQQAYLKASNTGAGDVFGSSVAVSGDRVVVGANGEDSATTGVNSTPNEGAGDSGAAFVFVRSGTTWSQQAYLKPGNTGAGDQFGYSVAVSGDTVVVGAYGEDSGTTGVNSTPNESANSSGAAYVFNRSGTTWSQQAYLKASNPGVSDQFGIAVGVSGDTVVVGASVEDSGTTGVNSTPNESGGDSGAAYVFVRSVTVWSQQAYLKAGNTGVSDQFGWAVAVSGDIVVVGALGEDSGTSGVNSTPNESATDSGAAYIFTGLGPVPTITGIFPASGSAAGGTNVVITGTGFTGATAVAFGGTPATSFTVNNGTSIFATTPAHSEGVVNVVLTTSAGTATGTNLFTYLSHTFANTAPLATTRYNHTATLLPNGKLLVVGGENNGSYLASTELYDPATGTWAATGTLATARYQHTATLLPNGMLLVAGGAGNSGSLASAELYDPATGTWTATGSLATARSYHTATLLPNGKVLLAGGLKGIALTSAELYDPATGTWSATGSLATARYAHTAMLLPNGKPVVAGGTSGSGFLASAELYDPATGTWTVTNPLATARYDHTATLLPNGKLLVAGGYNDSSLASAELYDSATGTWTATAPLATARFGHTATLLPNGKLLVAGGHGNSNPLASAELYDSASGTWTATGSLATTRHVHTATLLANGKVLVAGGYGSSPLASAELYDSAIGTWATSTNALTSARSNHTSTLLPNGKVLVAGGDGNSGSLANTELYDPATGTWATSINALTTARSNHTATLLPNGKVLVAGGDNNGNYLTSAELYDPATGSWTVVNPLVTARAIHTATLLPNGKLLVAGGYEGSGGFLTSAELYDPATGIWTDTGPLANARSNHTAMLLPNGKVFVTGGYYDGNRLASAELYDPATGAWTATSPLAAARLDHTATMLANGKVLVAGGNGNSGSITTAELYDTATSTWSTTTALANARDSHTATLLPNGKVLVAGGNNNGSSIVIAELYDPATGTWTATGSLANTRRQHTATLLPNGKLLVTGGFYLGSHLASAEIYDVGLSYPGASQPVIGSASFDASGKLVLTGTGFLGISSASGGNGSQDSPTNYPVLQLRRLDNEQCAFLSYDPSVNVSATSLRSLPVTAFSGYALATVFTNGIPSISALVSLNLTPPEAWRYQYFQIISNTGNAADLADPDHDGLINLLERAFNLNPLVAGRPILTAGTGTSGLPLIRRTGQPPVFSIQYLRRKASAHPGLTYTPQISSTLNGDWSTATGTETVQSIDTEWERMTVEQNATGHPKRFGRVKVMASP